MVVSTDSTTEHHRNGFSRFESVSVTQLRTSTAMTVKCHSITEFALQTSQAWQAMSFPHLMRESLTLSTNDTLAEI